MFRLSGIFRQPRIVRWLPFLALALLLHLGLIQWALSPFAMDLVMREPEAAVVSADLRLSPLPQDKPAATAPATTPERTRRKPATKPAKPVVSDEEGPEESAAAEAAPETAPPPKPVPPPTPVADNGLLTLAQVPQFPVKAPPSVELRYRAHSLHKGDHYYGKGRIQWQANGDNYKVKGEFGVLFINVLDFSSEGTIDPNYGVAPTVYAEKRKFRSETNTHFHRERKTISFSASALKYRRQGGEQDRASIVWQLAGIGRRNPERFKPGAVLDIVVAGSRGADIWKFRIGELEEIETDAGKMRAWRITRSPRPGTFEQTFDLWLAPQFEWYPVKLRYTNANGDFLELSLTESSKSP